MSNFNWNETWTDKSGVIWTEDRYDHDYTCEYNGYSGWGECQYEAFENMLKRLPENMPKPTYERK
jgi:hypothetical protein